MGKFKERENLTIFNYYSCDNVVNLTILIIVSNQSILLSET